MYSVHQNRYIASSPSTSTSEYTSTLVSKYTSICNNNQMSSTTNPYLWCAPYISNLLTGSNYQVNSQFHNIQPKSQRIVEKNMPMTNVKPMKIVKELGRGSYGKVYEVTDSEGERYAVKIIPNLNNGPPDILEASIMSTINHPGIAKAVSISLTNEKMCIFQRLARSDLAHYCTPQNYVGGPLLKSWSSTLVQAISCLHQEHIIHCDIKASNVLLYMDNNIAITDFTLAVLNVQDSYYDHPICTVTHRPPECFMGKKWSYPVDIWSLGLTLYELATGQLLIPFQGEDLTKKKDMDKEVKKEILNERTLACIMNWLVSRGEVSREEASRYNTREFIPVTYCPAWEATSQEFKNMVLSMLRYKPEDRPTATQLLTCDYLEGIKFSEYYNLSTPAYELDPGDQRLLERMSATYKLEPETVLKTKELYSRCIREGMIKDLTLVIGCIWIASKITYGETPRVSMPLIQVLEKEREICRILKYRLHSASMDAVVEVY